MKPSPVKTSEETTALAHTLTAALGETVKHSTQLAHYWTLNPQKTGDNKRVLFEATKFVEISYT